MVAKKKKGSQKGRGNGGRSKKKGIFGISPVILKRALPILLKIASPRLTVASKKSLLGRSSNQIVNLVCKLLQLLVKLKLKNRLAVTTQHKLRNCLMQKGAYFKYITNFSHPLRLRKKVLLMPNQRGSGFGLIPLALSSILDPIIKAILPSKDPIRR